MCLAIISQVKTVKRGNLAAQRDAVFSLHPIVTKNLIIAKKTKWYDYTNDIEKFLIEVQSTELFKNASKTIGIDLFIAELSAIKLRHDENCSTRTHLKNERLSLEKQKLRKVILKKISNLLAAIELAPVSNKTFDFKPLTIALNSVITNSNAVIRSRKTRNINKVIKKESVAPTIKSNATETLPVGA